MIRWKTHSVHINIVVDINSSIKIYKYVINNTDYMSIYATGEYKDVYRNHRLCK